MTVWVVCLVFLWKGKDRRFFSMICVCWEKCFLKKHTHFVSHFSSFAYIPFLQLSSPVPLQSHRFNFYQGNFRQRANNQFTYKNGSTLKIYVCLFVCLFFQKDNHFCEERKGCVRLNFWLLYSFHHFIMISVSFVSYFFLLCCLLISFFKILLSLGFSVIF